MRRIHHKEDHHISSSTLSHSSSALDSSLPLETRFSSLPLISIRLSLSRPVSPLSLSSSSFELSHRRLSQQLDVRKLVLAVSCSDNRFEVSWVPKNFFPFSIICHFDCGISDFFIRYVVWLLIPSLKRCSCDLARRIQWELSEKSKVNNLFLFYC